MSRNLQSFRFWDRSSTKKKEKGSLGRNRSCVCVRVHVVWGNFLLITRLVNLPADAAAIWIPEHVSRVVRHASLHTFVQLADGCSN